MPDDPTTAQSTPIATPRPLCNTCGKTMAEHDKVTTIKCRAAPPSPVADKPSPVPPSAGTAAVAQGSPSIQTNYGQGQGIHSEFEAYLKTLPPPMAVPDGYRGAPPAGYKFLDDWDGDKPQVVPVDVGIQVRKAGQRLKASLRYTGWALLVACIIYWGIQLVPGDATPGWGDAVVVPVAPPAPVPVVDGYRQLCLELPGFMTPEQYERMGRLEEARGD